jgi:hypothetical protein
MPTSAALGNSFLDFLLSGGVLPQPENVEICLYTEMPTEAGGGTELAAASYGSQVLACDLTNFPASVDKTKTNGVLVDFGSPLEEWSDIAGVVIRDADTTDFLMFAEFAAPVTAEIGLPLRFPAGYLVFTAL